MNGDSANYKNTELRPIVTAVGNAWVICNSKSRPGLKYYFNTFSGQAVWNLSPEDIEKAKKYTNGLPASELEKCPEPLMDPPTNPSQANHMQAVNYHSSGQIPNQIPNIFPMNLLNIGNMAGMPGVSGMNPLVWNNSPNNAVPTPPFIYVIAQPPVNYQAPQEQTQNLPYTNPYVKSQSQLNNYVRESNNNKFKRSNDIMHNNKQEEDRFAYRNTGPTDLRQKLIRKRSRSFSANESELPTQFDDINHRSFRTCYDPHTHFAEKSKTQSDASKYDLSVLDQIKSIHSEAMKWFIVVDTNIILKNFPFLNKLTDPDQNCFLFVPDHVMRELQDLASTSRDIAIRRILRFLTEQINVELAFKGDEITNGADDSCKMFADCERLATQSNVILLSDNDELYKFKNVRRDIHMLTLEELKRILNQKIVNLPSRVKSPTLDIKIVVPNDTQDQTKFRSKEKENPQAYPPALQPSEDSLHRVVTKENLPQTSENLCKTDHNPPFKTHAPVDTEKLLQTLSLSNSEERNKIKLSRHAKSIGTIDNGPPTRYRWRKQRDSKINTSQPRVDMPKKQQEASHAVESITAEGNSLPKLLISPTRASSVDRSTTSSLPKGYDRPKVIIEETSTSGVISNTTADSDSLKSINLIKTKETLVGIPNMEMVKFQVVGQSMEEVLKIRREEWVLRFVQIMEETLREILKDDSQIQSKDPDYTPPWATDLPELSRLIIKKFCNHFNVVDASNKLSFLLQRISDSKGNISKHIEPQQYMDMYSYGVYLIDALKQVTEDCEDLTTAEEQLKKILFDIQNANQECCQNDTFIDEVNESAVHANKRIKKGDLHNIPDSENLPAGENLPDKNVNNNTTLSALKGNLVQIEKELEQRCLTKSERKFFTSLSLAKKCNTDKRTSPTPDFQSTPITTPNSARLALTSPPILTSPKTLRKSPRLSQKANSPSSKETLYNIDKDSSNNAKEPDNEKSSSAVTTYFVRNFSSIAQFEEKLKNRTILTEPEEEGEFDEDNYYVGYDDQYDEDVGFDADDDCKENAVADYKRDASDQSRQEASDQDRQDGSDQNRQDGSDLNTQEADDNYEQGAGDNYDHKDAEFSDLEEGEIIEESQLEKPTSNAKVTRKSDQKKRDLKFKWFIKQYIDEIAQVVKRIGVFCAKFVEELRNSQKPSPKMQEQITIVCVTMKTMKDKLDSILERNSREYENNLTSLLKQANLEDYSPSKEVLREYTNIAREQRDLVNTWHQLLNKIMEVGGLKKVT